MATSKEQLKDIIDSLPNDKLEKIKKYIDQLLIPEVAPTEEEKEAIEKARKNFEKGEYHTLDEFLKEIEDD